nr:hypothetical protein [Leptospiraceae bacterium]
MKKSKLKKLLFIYLLFLSPNLVHVTSEHESTPPELVTKKEVDRKNQTDVLERETRKELVRLEKSMTNLALGAINNGYIHGASLAIYYKQNLVFEVNEVFRNSTP